MNREEAIEVLDSRPYTGEVREALETLIPELAESEDERIKKGLIEALKASKTVGELKFVLPYPTREECIAYLEKQKKHKSEDLNKAARDYASGIVDKEDAMMCKAAFEAGALWQKEQKPQLYWHKIKAYEKLPCRAYIYKFAYEQENNFHGKATIHGCLIPNEPVTIGCDTWYLPMEDIKNLPKEDEVDTTSLMKTEEQKLVWGEEEMKLLDLIINDYEKVSKSFCGYAGKIGLLKAIHNGEYNLPKPAEWSEDWREEDIQTRFAFYTYKDEDGVLYLSNVFVEETSRNHGFGTRILRAAEKVAEIIGATTISLKVKQDSPANAWYRKNGYGYVAFEDGYDWLEKNLEYMKPNKQEWSEKDEEMYINVASSLRGYACGLENEEHKKHIKKELDWLENRFKSLCLQPKQEWSEEDEKNLELVIDCIYEFYPDPVMKYKLKDWLKSLRPSWKPSVEQMSALKEAYESYDFFDGERDALESLYEQLKQL